MLIANTSTISIFAMRTLIQYLNQALLPLYRDSPDLDRFGGLTV